MEDNQFKKRMDMVLYRADEGDVSVEAYIKDETNTLDLPKVHDLKLLLTGFFDAHDFTYHSDNTVVNRIGEILLFSF